MELETDTTKTSRQDPEIEPKGRGFAFMCHFLQLKITHQSFLTLFEADLLILTHAKCLISAEEMSEEMRHV